ncbi:MAG TPA: hypoxanthine phosphoribosyltransferase [Synergistaceae bacterium]|jgi:hypoxanthine phosphoribosyltransferase|nr:MAG: Hypoxanthine phosphoribosyltransferase [Synergistales bacterium 57_84]KUK89028.1 MAG: Hypoxanthine phosphoribosyltransferase [Synergistales bacterium 58_81]HAK41210.1 hypoxanthine phosphoribosyltransferase [Synergistaceae bacterium]HPA59571.1 hypoxanthine phosphoribosyltransferase [Synergistales bacterium]HBG14724.1 hypoxanthine phosphoribosyltransferase [Synergistaceae bacterium]
MGFDLGEVLIRRKTIQERVRELAFDIGSAYGDMDLVLIGVLKGAVVFLSDLIRELPVSITTELDFLAVTSYGPSTESSGVVRIIKDLDININGRNVIIVEDIVDTGLTLSYLVSILREREPEMLEICSLLDKPSRRKTEIDIAFKGFEIPDEFVVGYGLDYSGRWRNLPEIHTLKKRD